MESTQGCARCLKDGDGDGDGDYEDRDDHDES